MTNRRPTSAATLVALFALTYAIAVFCIGIAPVTLMAQRFVGAAAGRLWLASLGQLLLRAAAATAACWGLLALTGRARAPLTGRGSLALGALASGALAGALDVVVHRGFVHTMVAAAHISPIAAQSVSLALTMLAAAVIALAFLVRGTRIAAPQATT